jgi:RimJ/RimL family protein N-acetyltransferase
MRHSFYQLPPGQPILGSSDEIPGLRTVLWRPSAAEITPPGVNGAAFKAWWVFHQLRIFANREYALLLMYDGERLVHRSGIYPRYFRFPFMGDRDLQIGDTWTDPEYRSQGLAQAAVVHIARSFSRPGRTLWYLAESDNEASVRVIERLGFKFVGAGERTRPLGIRALGQFRLTSRQGVGR